MMGVSMPPERFPLVSLTIAAGAELRVEGVSQASNPMNIPTSEGSSRIFQAWNDTDERVRLRDRKWIGVFGWNGSKVLVMSGAERYRTQVLSEAEKERGKDKGERAFRLVALF